MLYEDIEACLGAQTVREVEAAVEKAFVCSRRSGRGPEALIRLITSQLAIVIAVADQMGTPQQRAQDCAADLLELVRTMIDIEQPAKAS